MNGESHPESCPCEGYGSVPSPLAEVCTCGAAERRKGELSELVVHDVSCNAVPCPFGALAGEGFA